MEDRTPGSHSPGSRSGGGGPHIEPAGMVFVIQESPDRDAEAPLAELLAEHGYQVEKAADGERALANLPDLDPDLIVLDVRSSETGLGLVRDLLRHPELRDVPLLVISATPDVQARFREAAPAGTLDHVIRPFEPRELLARVERQVTVSKVRAALSESEAKFRSVMESAIDAIISADASGLILAWNRAASALFGFTVDEAIGQPIEVIIPERFRKAHREGMHRVSTGGESRVIGSTVELAAVRKGGIEFPIELSLATWTLDEKRYYTGIIRDISERKEAEKKFRSVTDSAIDAIISADGEGRIVGWNTAATRILGYPPEEALGQPLEIIIPDRHHDAHRGGLKRVATGGPSRVIGRTVELHARTRSGVEIPIELSLSTWVVHDERYFTGIIRDISERKRAEEQLKKYTAELARQHEELVAAQAQLVDSEKQALLGRLAAGLLHEVNNPLGALRSAADTLSRALKPCQEFVAERGGPDDEAAQRARRAIDTATELSRIVAESSRRIEDVVAGLGHFISGDRGGRRRHDVCRVIRSALTLFHHQLGERIRVRTSFPAQPAHVSGDEARLGQAFLNLIENAIQAIDGRGEIEVVVTPSPGDRIDVSITDTGCGMEAAELVEAFELGFTKREGRVRLRMGLSLTKRAIEEAGGSLVLESEPGRGTRARVSLPAAAAPD